jgi:hypothetical protein
VIPQDGGLRHRDDGVQAFNDDLPFDRFLTEQIAGDALVDRRKAATSRPRRCACSRPPASCARGTITSTPTNAALVNPIAEPDYAAVTVIQVESSQHRHGKSRC